MLKQIIRALVMAERLGHVGEKAVQLLQGILPVGVKIAGWGCSLLEASWTEMDREPVQTS